MRRRHGSGMSTTISYKFCFHAGTQGKTLTMLSLILVTKGDIPTQYSKSTLIGMIDCNVSEACCTEDFIIVVVPLSVLSNWEKQIVDHVVPGTLTSCVYYGASRSMTSLQLKEHDIVITTYETVTGEHDDKPEGEPKAKKRKTQKALFGVQWKVRRPRLHSGP